MSLAQTLPSIVATSFLLFGAASLAAAAEPVAIGQPAPEFTLRDQAGQATSLSDLVKKRPVALVFYRSADW